MKISTTRPGAFGDPSPNPQPPLLHLRHHHQSKPPGPRPPHGPSHRPPYPWKSPIYIYGGGLPWPRRWYDYGWYNYDDLDTQAQRCQNLGFTNWDPYTPKGCASLNTQYKKLVRVYNPDQPDGGDEEKFNELKLCKSLYTEMCK